ncbi:MAG: hypothetical protein AAGA90_23460 [Actinomycetota bacterium]
MVLDSIRSLDDQWCVDVFEHASGGFGFEHFRAEPEDGGRWTPVGGFSGQVYPTAVDALDDAAAQIGWLTAERPDVIAVRERLTLRTS